MIEVIKSRLVADWRNASRWWSVRMNAIGALLLPLLTLVPSMPPEIQAIFPPSVRAGLAAAWCIATIAVRLMAQRTNG